jgi:hypothetical protein
MEQGNTKPLQASSAPAGPYEPPRVEVIGSLKELTLGPSTSSVGDGVALRGPKILS